MFRILKIVLFILCTYAIVTATPAQHQDMIKGIFAFKDAFFQACTREGSLCTLVLEKIQTSLFSRGSSADTTTAATPQSNFSPYSNLQIQSPIERP